MRGIALALTFTFCAVIVFMVATTFAMFRESGSIPYAVVSTIFIVCVAYATTAYIQEEWQGRD